jgi:hypothetical protein
MLKPTMSQLAHAHGAARLRGSLAGAMQSPTLARCLEITALALAQPRADRYRPPPAAPPPALPPHSIHQQRQPFRDLKRASAADKDEIE